MRPVSVGLIAGLVAGCSLFPETAPQVDATAGTGNAGGNSGIGGQGGTAAVGGSGGASGGNGGASGGPGCPAGMVTIPTGTAGRYCVDATEVTQSAYQAFLTATGNNVTGQDAVCNWNTTYVPSDTGPCADAFKPASKPNHPASCVDWCDAVAYCKWANKRLCGRISGGSNAFGDFANADRSQWFKACSAGSTTVYPYGNAYEPKTCNGSDFGGSEAIAVKAANGCRGPVAPYDDLFDLAGNVWEWEDSCNGTSGATDLCRRRGGSVNSGQSGTQCASQREIARDTTRAIGGFRCCD